MPNRQVWYAVLPHFRVAQLGVSEELAAAADEMWRHFAPNPKQAQSERTRRNAWHLSAEQLAALRSFMERLRKHKWNI